MNRMKSILLHIIFVKFKLADLNLDDDFVPFLVSSISSQNGREESIYFVTEETRFLPSTEETCQPCL